jgi:hypothetical protein
MGPNDATLNRFEPGANPDPGSPFVLSAITRDRGAGRLLDAPSEVYPTMKVRLDSDSKRILIGLLGSPKTAGEVSRIFGIPIAVVWEKLRRLQELGLVHLVLTFVDSSGEMRRYFEGVLPIDTSDEEIVVEM